MPETKPSTIHSLDWPLEFGQTWSQNWVINWHLQYTLSNDWIEKENAIKCCQKQTDVSAKFD